MKLHEALERLLSSRCHLVIRQCDGGEPVRWVAGLELGGNNVVVACRWMDDIELARRFDMDQLSEVLGICEDRPDMQVQLVRHDGTVVTLAQREAGDDGRG